MQWYYAENGQQKGPVDQAEFEALIASGIVRGETLVWREGMASWQPHASLQTASAQPSAGVAVADPGEMRFCSECGRQFPASELSQVGQTLVCPACKPAYQQRLGIAQPAAAMRYAGFWIRLLARLIDGILFQILLAAIRFPLGLSPFGLPLGGRSPSLAALMVTSLFGVAAVVLYEIFFVTAWGATVGKMILGLQIVRANGSRLTLGRSTGRYFAHVLSSAILLIGHVMAAFDVQKRALHDHICDTRVIHIR